MKALVLFSGGVDSTTALALAIQEHGKDNVVALSISYGQKHQKLSGMDFFVKKIPHMVFKF